ncbi:glycoside hydrolase family 104 protein [Phocaeicola vulgatus]|jgi:muramidase (phage lysozyme)|uniref:glycoside hydrolase family 24 protein n=1 Tax=Phocaeicola vulgatus TaxID=821 RepID=UPI00259AF03D|nr:glycoside hydrolase family 104 protein [uncultured Bacteroides sp.]
MINTKAIFKGLTKRTELKNVRIEAHWVNKEGVKIEKVFWNSTVKLCIEKSWIYNVNIRIFIKSEDTECILYEEVVQPFYLLQNEKNIEVEVKYGDVCNVVPVNQKCELLCSVSNGFGFFYEEIIASIQVDFNPCICEARVRAFMTMLRVGEGTEDEKGYSRLVGGGQFFSFSDHPRKKVKLNKTLSSTAAGAYQILAINYDDNSFKKWRRKNGIMDFSPKNQDACCYWILKFKRKAIDDIKKGNIIKAISLCRKEWASLPGAGYGQREEKLENILSKYDTFFQNEIRGITKLHIEYGFLEEKFHEICSCGLPADKKSMN